MLSIGDGLNEAISTDNHLAVIPPPIRTKVVAELAGLAQYFLGRLINDGGHPASQCGTNRW
ncbi:hypothetical protein, partial [Yersinia pseudotuberculosis]